MSGKSPARDPGAGPDRHSRPRCSSIRPGGSAFRPTGTRRYRSSSAAQGGTPLLWNSTPSRSQRRAASSMRRSTDRVATAVAFAPPRVDVRYRRARQVSNRRGGGSRSTALMAAVASGLPAPYARLTARPGRNSGKPCQCAGQRLVVPAWPVQQVLAVQGVCGRPKRGEYAGPPLVQSLADPVVACRPLSGAAAQRQQCQKQPDPSHAGDVGWLARRVKRRRGRSNRSTDTLAAICGSTEPNDRICDAAKAARSKSSHSSQ